MKKPSNEQLNQLVNKLLELPKEARQLALEEIPKSILKLILPSLKMREKFEEAIGEAFRKSLKPITSIPESAERVPIGLVLENMEETVKRVWAEAKFKAGEKLRKRPGKRTRISKHEIAFDKFIETKKIDLRNENQKSFINRYEGELESLGIGESTIKKYFYKNKKALKP